MTEIERTALDSLLSDIADTLPCMDQATTATRVDWIKRRIASRGLTLIPRDPTDADLERVARAIDSFGMDVAEMVEADEPDRAADIRAEIFDKARASYRAAVEGGE